MRGTASLILGLVAGCVYFNAMYDANREYDEGIRALQERSQLSARVKFDSVIAKTGRIIEDHPDSKYADDAALLKTRSELHNQQWESAVESSRIAAELSDDAGQAALADGLGAVALRQLGETAEADSLLTRALDAGVEGDDRALFLFERGLARQQLGRAEEAAADLEMASGERALSLEGRLTLALALRDVGEYERSAELSAQLLATAPVNVRSPLYEHIDSLAVLGPPVVDSIAAQLLLSPGLQPTRVAAFQYVRGRASMHAEDTAQAVRHFESAVEAASTTAPGAESAAWIIEIRLRQANSPEDVMALTDLFPVARRSPSPEVGQRAAQRAAAAATFEDLIEAYESRGETAAEAVLRAAEISQLDLHAPAVARGLYLLYVEQAPRSRWAAKAIVGALSVSGHAPDPGWIRDEGLATDDRLRERLAGLPAEDPYRLVLTDPDTRTPLADSAYALAEADLRRRLSEIQMLFDPSVADTVPVVTDSVARPADDRDF